MRSPLSRRVVTGAGDRVVVAVVFLAATPAARTVGINILSPFLGLRTRAFLHFPGCLLLSRRRAVPLAGGEEGGAGLVRVLSADSRAMSWLTARCLRRRGALPWAKLLVPPRVVPFVFHFNEGGLTLRLYMSARLPGALGVAAPPYGEGRAQCAS